MFFKSRKPSGTNRQPDRKSSPQPAVRRDAHFRRNIDDDGGACPAAVFDSPPACDNSSGSEGGDCGGGGGE